MQEPTRAERTIGRRAAEARATVPDLELSTDVDVSGVEVTLPRVIAACARALREHPRANASYRDGQFELHERVNIGVVLSSSDSYVVPTIFDADAKSTSDLTSELERLENRRAAGELTQPELSGATFVISDFGRWGIARASAILTPPHAAALVTGVPRSVPIVRDGDILPGVLMSLTLVCDHRILFGAEAAGFLGRIAELVQQP